MAESLRKRIDDEIRGGLPNERHRLDDALFNLEFYRGDFARFPVRPAGSGDRHRYQRTAPVMRRVVNLLASNLYKEGPRRTLPDHPKAQAWLDNIYKRNRVDALLQQADRLRHVGDVVAIQAEPTADPDRPVKLRLWDASQFCAWCDPDEPDEPLFVAILDQFNEQRRLRLYTDQDVTTYLTEPLGRSQVSGGTAYRQAGLPKPHGLGRLPFAFVHFDLPFGDFWGCGPGTGLRGVNDCINFGLTNGFDNLRYNLNPYLVAKHTRPGWRPPSPARPGDVLFPPSDADEMSGAESEPDLSYLQAEPAYVAASWDDTRSYLDLVFETHGIPPSAFRMEQDSARSGVAILGEQAELVKHAEACQRPYGYYEDGLARLTLTVGSRHLGRQADPAHRATAGQLAAAATDPNLTLRWPTMYAEMPGDDQDRADQWSLEAHIESRTTILMRRAKYSRAEAEAYLEEVAKDLKREQALFDDVNPMPEPGAHGANPEEPDDDLDLDGDDDVRDRDAREADDEFEDDRAAAAAG